MALISIIDMNKANRNIDLRRYLSASIPHTGKINNVAKGNIPESTPICEFEKPIFSFR